MENKKLTVMVGEAIARQRKKTDLTQAQVAEHLKIETETVSRLETGTIAPTLKRLEQLSELFDCPITSFFQNTSMNLSSQAQAIADMLEPLTKEERQLVVAFVEDVTTLITKRRA